MIFISPSSNTSIFIEFFPDILRLTRSPILVRTFLRFCLACLLLFGCEKEEIFEEETELDIKAYNGLWKSDAGRTLVLYDSVYYQTYERTILRIQADYSSRKLLAGLSKDKYGFSLSPTPICDTVCPSIVLHGRFVQAKTKTEDKIYVSARLQRQELGELQIDSVWSEVWSRQN